MSETMTMDVVLPELKANNQKQAFQVITEYAADHTGLDQKKLFDRLMAWERKAAISGIGEGVAILHLSIKDIERPFMMLARASQKVDYDSVDGEPVDLIVLLLSPEEDGPYHLQRLARISRILRDKDLCNRLRGANSSDAIRALLYDPENTQLAA